MGGYMHQPTRVGGKQHDNAHCRAFLFLVNYAGFNILTLFTWGFGWGVPFLLLGSRLAIAMVAG